MTKPQFLPKIDLKVPTLLKCPRCTNRFDADSAAPTPSGHVVCPNCSAKLRFRPRAAVAAPQPSAAADGSGEIAMPGLMDSPGTSSSDSSISLTDSSISLTDSSVQGDLVLPGLTDSPAPAGADGSSPGAAVQAPAPPPSARSKEPDTPLEPGTRLGGFEVRRVLGRGGMATVYKATQLSLNRPVAVKVLAKRFARNQLFVDRFDREAGALAGLNHPNIVNIIDKGVIDDNYFFVMEIVEGITLDQLLHSVELTEQHYLHLVGEISKALAYVHSRGIIHRDIKPSNILVNRQGVVKVGDFGIAHMTDAEAPAERFSRKATVGTAHYMSPEQATDPASVDQRADIYSLAVTFYKMFTRQLPPAGATSGMPPSEINPALPKSVDAIIAKGMDPDPARRYSDVAEFCDALITAFTSRTGSDLVGAAATSASNVTESGTFLFNTNLFTAAPASPSTGSGFGLSAVTVPAMPEISAHATPPSPDTTGGGSLLSAPLSIAGLEIGGSDPGVPSYQPAESASFQPSFSSTLTTPLASGPTFSRPEPAAPAAVQEEDSGRKKLFIILGAVLVALALIAGGAFAWWLYYSSYGSILK